MAEQICPTCFRLIPGEVKICPACGADLSVLSARNYRDKLLAALDHPLDDVRMRAILALGLRGETNAGDALVECALRHPGDVVEGLAVVATLIRLGDSGRDALARLGESHPAHVVREVVRQTQENLAAQGDADA